MKDTDDIVVAVVNKHDDEIENIQITSSPLAAAQTLGTSLNDPEVTEAQIVDAIESAERNTPTYFDFRADSDHWYIFIVGKDTKRLTQRLTAFISENGPSGIVADRVMDNNLLDDLPTETGEYLRMYSLSGIPMPLPEDMIIDTTLDGDLLFQVVVTKEGDVSERYLVLVDSSMTVPLQEEHNVLDAEAASDFIHQSKIGDMLLEAMDHLGIDVDSSALCLYHEYSDNTIGGREYPLDAERISEADGDEDDDAEVTLNDDDDEID